MSSESKLNIIKVIIIIGFVLSILFHYILTVYMGVDFKYLPSFFTDSEGKFGDFFSMLQKGLDPYSDPPANYGPLTFIFFYLFGLFPGYVPFLLFVLSFLGFLLVYFFKNIYIADRLDKLLLVFTFSFMSYPVFWIINRGNIEAWVFIFLALFVFYYQKGKDKISLFFLSIAIAIKLYPVIFIILFLADKKYKNILFTFFFTSIITVISSTFLKGGIVASLIGFWRGLTGFGVMIYSVKQGIIHSVSLFALFKVFIYGLFALFPSVFPVKSLSNITHSPLFYKDFFGGAAHSLLSKFYFIYPFFALIVFLLVSMFILGKEKTLWKKVALLVFCILLLPQISYDYKLIHIFIPLILFVNFKGPDKYDIFYSVLFGLLLIPKDYIFFIGDLSISVILNPLIMVFMAFLIIKSALKHAPYEIGGCQK